MRRYIFLLSVLLFIGFFFVCNPNKKRLSTSNKLLKPNIIFLLADDQRDNTFRVMGHPIIQSPNFDRLIRQGVRFSNSYIATPVCSPSRISLFTGMPERVHGVGFSSSYQITEEQWSKTYPAILRENGYYTGFIGKFGVEYYTFRGNAGEKFDFWLGHDGWTKFFPKEYNNFSCDPYHDLENEIITPIMGEAMTQFLESVPAEKPFILSVSFNVPHGSQTTSMYDGYEGWHDMLKPANENPKLLGHPVYGDLYRDKSILVPEDCTSDPYRFIPRFILDQEKGRNKTYSYNYSIETCREHHIRYYQTITGMDKVVGGLIAELANRDLMDNTIIIFASDHGLIMGEYGMGGKELLYDLSSKIPCFIYDPNLPERDRGRTVNKLVSSLDIPATILGYAGVKVPEEMTGSSLIPLIRGDDELEWRDELFLESLFTLRDNPFCEGIRTGDWKYIRMFDGILGYTEEDLDFGGRTPEFEQLFNLKNDPDETNNLIDKYEGSELLMNLREKVQSHSVKLNHQRLNYMTNTTISQREN